MKLIILLDSNTIIYLSKKLITIDDILENTSTPLVSVISYMEVLGYCFEDNKKRDFIDKQIAKNTIKLSEENKIKLPDAIICATALQRRAKLITSDEKLKMIYDKSNNQR